MSKVVLSIRKICTSPEGKYNMGHTVQGCIDCQTPMVDMEKWGKCPNCGSREIGPIVIATQMPVVEPTRKVGKGNKLYKLTYNEGGIRSAEIFVDAKNPQEARRMLCYWCEREGKSLISSYGLSLCFVRRTTSAEKKIWQKALNRGITSEMYCGAIPSSYLSRNALGQVHLTA